MTNRLSKIILVDFELHNQNYEFKVQVDCTCSNQKPDYATWESDWDYYGGTEIESFSFKVEDVKVLNEDTNEYEPSSPSVAANMTKEEYEEFYIKVFDTMESEIF